MVATMHPRSRTTTGLFGATLAVSFLVVGLPHVLPCPAPRTSFADSEMTEDGRRRRKRRVSHTEQKAKDSVSVQAMPIQEPAMTEAESIHQQSRECPVPKPGGILGRVFGFEQTSETRNQVPADIKVEKRKA